MERVDVRLPRPLIERIDAIAQRRGSDRSSMLRDAIEEGLPILLQRETADLEYENKVLVNQKLKLSIDRLKGEQQSLWELCEAIANAEANEIPGLVKQIKALVKEGD